jgi:isoleucyl-tRNA synthetase
MLVHDLQPILVYTTDEVMKYLPASMRDGQTYAALLDWYEAPVERDEYERYLPVHGLLNEVRATFTKAYEEESTKGVFEEKSPQATRAELTLPHEYASALLGDDPVNLAEVFVCSEVCVHEGEELTCEVLPAHGEKCPRCWNWREPVEDGLCERCRDVIASLEREDQ